MSKLSPEATELPTSLLHLAKRTHKRLSEANILTLEHFVQLNDSRLKNISNLSRRSVDEIKAAQNTLLGSLDDMGEVCWLDYCRQRDINLIPETIASGESNQDVISEFSQTIKATLEQESDKRLWTIVQRRFGLEETNALSLEELGVAFGLTRERVRQLEAKALGTLREVLFEDDFTDKTYRVQPKVVSTGRILARIVKSESNVAIGEESLLQHIQNR